MALRMTGMMSGMDTESIIQQLVAAKRTNVDKVTKQQTKLEWKQETWKELNTKLKNLQSKYVANLRFSDSYMKKTTKVSNDSAVSVITGDKAMNGVQTLQVKQLAKTGYLTGAKMQSQSGESLTALSKLSDLTDGISGTGTIDIKAGDKQISMEITADTTISDVLTQLKDAGLNANFDEKQQRLYVSSKESGLANDFSITSSDADGMAAITALGLDYSAGGEAKKIDGQDAVIVLNEAEYTNSTNVFEINGLTITALNETKAGEQITLSTQDDTEGIYDMIKNFIKEYNSVINELDKLYNAESAGSYEPLTDEEKEALSESEVEKYEKKVKDSLLRHDSTASSIMQSLKKTMGSGIEIGGKTYYLSSFGIDTLGYFDAADNERNAYHIDGDADDSATSANANTLKAMIGSDPDTVVSFFSTLNKNLYTAMSDLSTSIKGYRSFGNFYDDIKMKSDYADYTTKIAELEEKLNDYEDSWYSKFSKMETALAKMQSNASAITGLLGGS